MRKLLLTSSQVSLLFTICITLLFTVLLFIAGVTVQRRTLHNLHTTLRPNLPPIPASHPAADGQSASPRQTLRISGSPDSASAKDYVTFLERRSYDAQKSSVDWSTLAHVQTVSKHNELCSAVMLFADLHRLKSPARRVLLFPSHWLGMGPKGAKELAEKGVNAGLPGVDGMRKVRADVVDPYTSSTRRLLRLAARRYMVELRPVEADVFGKRISRETSGTTSSEKDAKSWLDWFATSSTSGEAELKRDARARAEEDGLRDHALLATTEVEDLSRIMLLRTPGWLLDATPLDGALAYSEMGDGGLAAFSGIHGHDAVILDRGGGAMLVLRKWRLEEQISSKRPTTDERRFAWVGGEDVALLEQVGVPVVKIDSSESKEQGQAQRHLTASISTLHRPREHEHFNGTAFLSDTSYVTFTDEKLPAGPEYEVPFQLRVSARPRNKDADWLWTKLYGMFAERRREVCGLDLEGWYG